MTDEDQETIRKLKERYADSRDFTTENTGRRGALGPPRGRRGTFASSPAPNDPAVKLH
jgi:hypothetical protein